MIIIPSILVQTKEEYISQISAVQQSLDMIQFDIADGKFVPNKTWADPEVVEQYTNIDVELHLMVQNPLAELERWTATEVVKRVLFHYEAVADFKNTLKSIKKFDWEVGVVLNPDTDLEKIKPYLADLDCVMFMGVYPGFQGQSLIPEVLEKIVEFNSEYSHIFTEIDGAVNFETLPDIVQTEVKAICPGSAIFKTGNPADNVKRMREIINIDEH
jgi:ribulose-phosphate 3-epimerase